MDLTPEDLLRWRLTLCISQKEMARRLFLQHKNRWQEWESGLYRPSGCLSYIYLLAPDLPDLSTGKLAFDPTAMIDKAGKVRDLEGRMKSGIIVRRR